MSVFGQFFAQTPLGVWCLLAYLIFRGVKARRPAQTSLLKMAVIPVIFTAWGLIDLVRLYGAGASSIALWLAGICIGTAIGWRLLAHADIRPGPAAGTVQRPADFTLLPLLLTTFAIKYTFGVISAISPDLLQHSVFWIVHLFSSSTFTGIFIGKLARYVRGSHPTGAAASV